RPSRRQPCSPRVSAGVSRACRLSVCAAAGATITIDAVDLIDDARRHATKEGHVEGTELHCGITIALSYSLRSMKCYSFTAILGKYIEMGVSTTWSASKALLT